MKNFIMIPIPLTRYVYSMDLHLIPHRKEDDLKLVEYIDKLSKEQYPSTPSNVMSWRSEWNSHKVHREVMKCFLGDLFRVFGDDKTFPQALGREIVLVDSWLSVQREGDWIRRHDHHSTSLNMFSFCYYLNMSEKSAPLLLHNYDIPSPNGRISETKLEVYPYGGNLIIMDGDLHHSVDNTIGDRFTIAGNVVYFDSRDEFQETEDGIILSARTFFEDEK